MAAIWSFIVNNIFVILGITGATALLGIIFKKVLPKEKFIGWGDNAEKHGAFIGKLVTDAAAQVPYIGKVWNKVIEPYLILLMDNVIIRWVMGFVGRKGLLSDNPTDR